MKKLLSIFFATIILLSNMGFSIASHYCQGSLVKTELVHGGNGFGCCMAKMSKQTPKDCKSPKLDKKSCCQNTYQNLDIEDDFNTSHIQIELNTQFLLTFFPTFFHLEQSEENIFIAQSEYAPPLIQRDLHVLHQVFLL